MTNEELNRVSKIVLEACIEVHRKMGSGLLESIYELCLLNEFAGKGVRASSQVSIPLMYKGTELSKDLRIDILVEDEIILENKIC